MRNQTYNEVALPELLEGAIDNNAHPGFLEDYKVLHALVKKYKPKTFFEVGTCDGTGAKIIKNALGEDSALFSLDLPIENIDKSLRVGAGDRVGKNCNLPFIQLRGDSMTFDFAKYACEGYWVDAAHTEENVYHETKEILKLSPKLVAYHDTDIEEVMRGLVKAFGEAPNRGDYELFRVEGTRVSYLLKIRE